jgi:Zn-dependent M28 family amino/carboxypeptidase
LLAVLRHREGHRVEIDPNPAEDAMLNAKDFADLETRLRKHVKLLAATPRPGGSAAHQAAGMYICDQLSRHGFRLRTAAHRGSGGVTCQNLASEPWPHNDDLPLVVLAAHYDSIPDSPGADDNASAVAALLEVARWFTANRPKPEECRARLQLVAYDLEEAGLIGSALHSRELQQVGEVVRGMISLEMLGYTDGRPGSQQLPPHLRGLYPDVGNFIGVVGNEASAALLGVVAAALRSVPGLPVEHLAVPGNGTVLPETRLSDHSSFWDCGFPALMVTDTSFFRNPHYHRASDTADTLDYPFLTRVTLGVCEAVRRLLTAA